MGSTSGPRCMVSGWFRRNQSPELELDKEIVENNGIATVYTAIHVWATEIPDGGIVQKSLF
jgi:hypothetical protein